MRSYETTHPYTITLTIDPADYYEFERLTRDREEIHLVQRETGPDLWTLQVACTSEEVARRMKAAWD